MNVICHSEYMIHQPKTSYHSLLNVHLRYELEHDLIYVFRDKGIKIILQAFIRNKVTLHYC